MQRNFFIRHVAEQVKAGQANAVGRHFDVSDDAGAEEFAEWLVEISDRLGLTLTYGED